MTPRERAIAWYRQQAEDNGEKAGIYMRGGLEHIAADHARLAAHFAGLVLVLESMAQEQRQQEAWLEAVRALVQPEVDTDPTGSVEVGR